MASEEINRTIEFILQQNAQFAVNSEQRLDQQRIEHGELMKEQEQLRRDIMHLLNMLLDRLPPLNN